VSEQGREAPAQRGEAERSAGPREQGREAPAQRGEAERSAGPREQGREAPAQRGEAERSAFGLVRHLGGFRWEGIPIQDYKREGEPFRDVTRQVLFGGEGAGPGELRYFEVGPGGWTTLERHAHVHQVVVLRGRGRALVGGCVLPLARFDLLSVPPRTWHQLRAAPDEPLGFLCLVDRERDRPERPGPAELEALRASPELAEFVRA
jgi:quercetin dioxygenase-like cupin family protein